MKEILSISAGSTVAKVTPSTEVKSDTLAGEQSSSDDFLSVMFSQIKNSAKKGETSTPQNTVENSSLQIKESTNTEIIDLKTTQDSAKKSLDDHLLNEVLEVISLLQNETPTTSFPKYSAKIESFLNDESIAQEFKDVKNIADLMKLSKKLDLGLEKLSISKVDYEAIKSEFPNLDKKSFFQVPEKSEQEVKNTFADPAKKNEIKSSQIPFNAMEKPTKQTLEKEPSIFEKIITKDIKSEPQLSKDEVKQPLKETLHVKNTEAKIVEKEIKNTQNIKEVSKQIISDVNDKKVSSEIVEEIILKDTLQTTRVNEVKVESQTDKKGFTEAMLQGLKSTKTSDEQTILKTAQNVQTSSDKTLLDTTSSDSAETKTEPNTNTLKADTTKISTKQDFISKQVSPTRDTWSTFADDLREKIENYKPPIMKVQLALNPKGLGEVDVTVINRGNNLHVNINSNTNTMALFTQNQAEFKNSLVNMGFTNLEMNFSDQRERSGEQTRDSNSSQNNHDETFEEQIEDETASLELVLPQYI